MPALASASRTVILTPRTTGTRAASSGTSSPTPISSANTRGGIENCVTSKFASPAVKLVNANAPRAPMGSATIRLSTAYARTSAR